MTNLSGKYYLLAGDGRTVVEGEGHPDGRTVLAAPGGEVPADVLARVPGLAELLGPPKAAPPPPVVKAVASTAAENKMVRPDQAENKAPAAKRN